MQTDIAGQSSGTTAARLAGCASELWGWGANVTAIAAGEKRPLHRWKAYQTTRQTLPEVMHLGWNGYRRADGSEITTGGLGVICGVNGWRTWDFDKCPDQDAPRRLLAALGLPATYPWLYRSGSGAGWGVVVRCTEDLPAGILAHKADEPGVFTGRPKAGDFDHLELRWDHCQTVLPPSAHPTGPGYRWANGVPGGPPATVTAQQVVAAFLAVATPDHPSAPLRTPAPARPRRHAPPAGTSRYSAPFCKLLDTLGVQYVRNGGDQLVDCVFHHDQKTPSLHVDPQRALFICFSPACPAHAGGGYMRLRQLALEEWGVMEAQPAADPAPPRLVIPWELTPDDWMSCPVCSAWTHSIGKDRRPRASHWICGDRHCAVSVKIRAGRTLHPMTAWRRAFVGAVAARDWRGVRDRAKRLGAAWLGVPTAHGVILATDRLVDGRQQERDLQAALFELMDAVGQTPEGTRIRRRQGTALQAAGAGTVACSGTEAEQTISLPVAERLPAGLRAADFRITLPPDGGFQALWRAVGATPVRGARGWTTADPLTDDQLRSLAREIRQLRAELSARVAASITNIVGRHRRIRATDVALGEGGETGGCRDEPGEPPLVDERRREWQQDR